MLCLSRFTDVFHLGSSLTSTQWRLLWPWWNPRLFEGLETIDFFHREMYAWKSLSNISCIVYIYMLYRYSYVYFFINCNHNPTHDSVIHSYRSCRNLAWGTRFSNACQWGKIGKMAWQHICKRADQLPTSGIKLIPEKQEILHFSIQTPTIRLMTGWLNHLKNMLVKLDHFPSVSGWKFQKIFHLRCMKTL